MRAKLPKTTVHPISYFEYNEAKADPRAVAVDVIPWEEPYDVKESTSTHKLEVVRDAWLKSIKDSNHD